MKVGKILMIIGGAMLALVVCGIFAGGAALIEAAFQADGGFIKVAGIAYIAIGVIGLVLFVVGFFIAPNSSTSPSNDNSSQTENAKRKNDDDDTTPIKSSDLYEYGTMKDSYGNEISVTHNTLTDTYTDAVGNSYYTDDGKHFSSDSDDD